MEEVRKRKKGQGRAGGGEYCKICRDGVSGSVLCLAAGMHSYGGGKRVLDVVSLSPCAVFHRDFPLVCRWFISLARQDAFSAALEKASQDGGFSSYR